MLVAWTLLVGCQQDLLLSLGDPTGINRAAASKSASSIEEGSLSPSAILIRSGEGEAPAPAPAAPPPVPTPDAAAAAMGALPTPAASTGGPPPANFNPISVPEDAPENTGVRWEGVKQKGTGRPSATVRYGKNGQPID